MSTYLLIITCNRRQINRGCQSLTYAHICHLCREETRRVQPRKGQTQQYFPFIRVLEIIRELAEQLEKTRKEGPSPALPSAPLPRPGYTMADVPLGQIYS